MAASTELIGEGRERHEDCGRELALVRETSGGRTGWAQETGEADGEAHADAQADGDADADAVRENDAATVAEAEADI